MYSEGRAVSLLLTLKQIWCLSRQCSKLNICLKLLKKRKNYVTFFSKRLLCLFVSLSWFIVIASLPLKIYKLCPSKRRFSLFFPRYNLIYMNLPKKRSGNVVVLMKWSSIAHLVFAQVILMRNLPFESIFRFLFEVDSSCIRLFLRQRITLIGSRTKVP